MKGSVHLAKPSEELRDAYFSFYEEWKNSGERIVPWVVEKDPSDFEAYLNYLREEESADNLPPGWVANSTYWLVNEEGRIAGAVNIRHDLNEKLRNSGGHIGYGVRPSERRKGYATAILAKALEKTKELGIARVLVVCDRGNTASEKTILKNGGVLESEFTESDGNVVRRFWIEP